MIPIRFYTFCCCRPIKKIFISGAAVLSILLFYISFTSYASNDYISEVSSFSRKYGNGADLSSSVYKDRYNNGNEAFTLYKNGEEYFIVWSKKSLLSLGRYRIEGGIIPFSSTEINKKLSEFEKQDENGYIYILYGKYIQDKIALKIEGPGDSKETKDYKVNGDHTFIVYPSNHDCIIQPEIT